MGDKDCPFLERFPTIRRRPDVIPNLDTSYPRLSSENGTSGTSMRCPRFPRFCGKSSEAPGGPVLNPNRGCGLSISRTLPYHALRGRYNSTFAELLAPITISWRVFRGVGALSRFPRDRGRSGDVPGDPVINPNRGLVFPISRTICDSPPPDRALNHPAFGEYLAAISFRKGAGRGVDAMPAISARSRTIWRSPRRSRSHP